VRFEVSAEMVYQGSVMNYTVKDTRIFKVRNSQQLPPAATKTEDASKATAEPASEDSKASNGETAATEEASAKKATEPVAKVECPKL